MYAIKDDTTKAELIMLLRTIANNLSLRSCDYLGDSLKAAFPDAVAAKKFTLNHNKAGYVLNEALGPYFRKEMLKDIDVEKYFTVLFDETTNSAGSKELQICVRYCSISTGLIVTSHLETFFISYATAVILVEKIKESLDNASLPLSKVIMLGMDGPNVNKTVFRLLNEEIQELRGIGIFNMGSCNIHTIHNGFLKGLQEFGHELGDLITQVCSINLFFDLVIEFVTFNYAPYIICVMHVNKSIFNLGFVKKIFQLTENKLTAYLIILK